MTTREPTEQEVEAVAKAILRVEAGGDPDLLTLMPYQESHDKAETPRWRHWEEAARAAIAAMPSGKARYIRCQATLAREVNRVLSHPIYTLGDTVLVWVNEGDILALGEDLDRPPSPPEPTP